MSTLYKGDRKKRESPANQCANCGKFAAYEDLAFKIDMSMDMGGNVRESEWAEHKRGRGCRANAEVTT